MKKKRIQSKPKRDTAPLSVRVTNGKLVIDIGIATLAKMFDDSEIVSQNSEDNPYSVNLFKVLNPSRFAQDVQSALLRKVQDELNLISVFLGRACEESLDIGSREWAGEYTVEFRYELKS